MSHFDREFRRVEPTLMRIAGTSLFAKRVIVEGAISTPESEGGIIIGNHIGSYKDIAVLLSVIPRRIYFTANRDLFSYPVFSALVRVHLKRHLKDFGSAIDILFAPLKHLFVDFISSNIAKVGTIPVDLSGQKRLAIEKCKEYVDMGRTIVTLQGRGRIMKHDPFPYVHPFRRGPAIIALNLWRESGKRIPLFPVALFGTHFPWGVPTRIHVKFGDPMYIDPYLNGKDEEIIERFRLAQEKRIKDLILDILRLRRLTR